MFSADERLVRAEENSAGVSVALIEPVGLLWSPRWVVLDWTAFSSGFFRRLLALIGSSMHDVVSVDPRKVGFVRVGLGKFVPRLE
jgi:hypothetical protein